jgi:hypothetical protein
MKKSLQPLHSIKPYFYQEFHQTISMHTQVIGEISQTIFILCVCPPPVHPPLRVPSSRAPSFCMCPPLVRPQNRVPSFGRVPSSRVPSFFVRPPSPVLLSTLCATMSARVFEFDFVLCALLFICFLKSAPTVVMEGP